MINKKHEKSYNKHIQKNKEKFMSWNDKCAVMGVWNHLEASLLTYLGLYSLQHRGQEGAGIIALDKKSHKVFKGQGLVGDVFSPKLLKSLSGKAAIGHTRYSTSGSKLLKNIQPLYKKTRFGPISIAHNGNISNHHLLTEAHEKNQTIKKSSLKKNQQSDTECLFYLLQKSQKKTFIPCLKEVLKKLEGAYSLSLLTKDSLIAVRDPLGFRPLVLGKKGQAYILASESCAFDLLGARYIREIKPGEILVINKQGLKSYFFSKSKKQAQCIFEHVYFSRPDSFIFGQNVYKARKKMGMYLAKEHPVKADLVIPVPDSGVPAAMGYSQQSKIPYELGIIRNHYIGRTFIHPSSSIRNFMVKIKLNPQISLIKGKDVVVVDDSIVRGTTSKSLIEVLRQAGAKKIHLRVSSPPIKGPCYYGVDTPQKKQLISGDGKSLKEICKYLKADSLAYLSEKSLLKASKGDTNSYCLACFNEKYPTKIYS